MIWFKEHKKIKDRLHVTLTSSKSVLKDVVKVWD